MMKKVRAVQYGCGKMGKYLIRYLQEHGAEVVAAFDINEAVIGKDIGEIAGTAKTGVKVQPLSAADAVLAELKPDVAIIATLSTMGAVDLLQPTYWRKLTATRLNAFIKLIAIVKSVISLSEKWAFKR